MPDRHTYDEARVHLILILILISSAILKINDFFIKSTTTFKEHIFNLMTRDSYNRFLRSDTYRDCLASAKKKVYSTS